MGNREIQSVPQAPQRDLLDPFRVFGDMDQMYERFFGKSKLFGDSLLGKFWNEGEEWPKISDLFPHMEAFQRQIHEAFEQHRQFFEKALQDPNADVHTEEGELPGGGHYRVWSYRSRPGLPESSIPLAPQLPERKEVITQPTRARRLLTPQSELQWV